MCKVCEFASRSCVGLLNRLSTDLYSIERFTIKSRINTKVFKILLCLITKVMDNPINQSKLKVNRCSRCEVQVLVCLLNTC